MTTFHPIYNELQAALARAIGEEWSVLAERDNLVLQSDTRVAKTPRTPDGTDRLANGLKGAIAAGQCGVASLQPEEEQLLEIDGRAVSLWPRVDHQNVSGRPEIFNEFATGWLKHQSIPTDVSALAKIKAIMATSFLLTLNPTSQLEEVIRQRCSAISAWEENRGAPSIPTPSHHQELEPKK